MPSSTSKQANRAQQHTTVESAGALKIQDKIEGKYDENI